MVKIIQPVIFSASVLAKLILATTDNYENNYSLFNSLAKDGDLDEIKAALGKFQAEARTDYINKGDHWKKTTIHYAAEYGHADIINLLSKNYKGDVTAKDYRGRTALHIAAQKGNSNAIKELLNISRDLIFELDNDNKNALHYAAETGQYSVIKALIGNHSKDDNTRYLDVNSQTSTGKTALMIAAERGHVDFLGYLLRDPRTQTDLRDAVGMNALMYASKIGHLPIAMMLINPPKDRDSTYDQKDNYGKTAFHYASIAGHSNLVQYMMRYDDKRTEKWEEAGSEGEAPLVHYKLRDSKGSTALHFAAKNGHDSICQQLLSKDSNTAYETDGFGQSPLILALRLPEQGFNEILEYHTPLPLGKYTCADLILRRVEKDTEEGKTQPGYINHKDRLGHTALSRAVEYGCTATINRLFKNKLQTADPKTVVEVKKNKGLNMIHYAIYTNNVHTIDTLLMMVSKLVHF